MVYNTETRKFVERGRWFQLPMIIVWMTRGVYYNVTEFFARSEEIFASSVTFFGLVIMVVSMLRIYSFNRKKQLLTSDIFSLTRHPMYHGMFLADAGTFLSANLSDPLFWVSWVIFVSLLFVAGWFQENETLARWGEEAKVYYTKTPRFIFEWIWRR